MFQFAIISLFVCLAIAQPCRIMFVTKGVVQGDFGVNPGPSPHAFADGLCNREAFTMGVARVSDPYRAGTMRFKVFQNSKKIIFIF